MTEIQAIENQIAELRKRRDQLRVLADLRTEVADLERGILASGNDEETAARTIIERVCEEFTVRFEDVLGMRRYAAVVIPRMVTYWLLRELSGMSYGRIGQIMRKKDHGGPMSGIRTIRNMMETDSKFAHRLEQLKERIEHEQSKEQRERREAGVSDRNGRGRAEDCGVRMVHERGVPPGCAEDGAPKGSHEAAATDERLRDEGA